MKPTFFRLVQSLLCLAAGVLLSVIELGFFGGAGIISIPFLIILIVTAPAVFLYVRSGSSAVFIFIYTVCIFFLLELLNSGINIIVLLACLFTLVLLHGLTILGQSAEKSHVKKPAYSLNFLIVLICAAVAAVSTFQIYDHVLRSNLPESQKYALLNREYIASNQNTPENESVTADPPDGQTAQTGIRKGDGDIAPPRTPPGSILIPGAIIVVAAAVCVVTTVVLYKYFKYRKWLKKTLASPPETQVLEFYTYFLCSLAVCGYPRKTHETPIEYLDNTQMDGFPLPAARFGEVTGAFVASQYGGKEISSSACESCRSLFCSLPALVKAKMGRRFYYLRYIRKMYG